MAPVGRCWGIPLRAFRANLHHHPSAVNERQSPATEGDLALRERISHALPSVRYTSQSEEITWVSSFYVVLEVMSSFEQNSSALCAGIQGRAPRDDTGSDHQQVGDHRSAGAAPADHSTLRYGVMAAAIDKTAARQLRRRRPIQVRTIPRGLLLVKVSGGLDPFSGGGLSAPELIALARSARGAAVN
jgi:hypothetical protein